jgi:hypothetical protein
MGSASSSARSTAQEASDLPGVLIEDYVPGLPVMVGLLELPGGILVLLPLAAARRTAQMPAPACGPGRRGPNASRGPCLPAHGEVLTGRRWAMTISRSRRCLRPVWPCCVSVSLPGADRFTDADPAGAVAHCDMPVETADYVSAALAKGTGSCTSVTFTRLSNTSAGARSRETIPENSGNGACWLLGAERRDISPWRRSIDRWTGRCVQADAQLSQPAP